MAHAADDTRCRLLEAAGETFAEKGFQAATVREICARAGANLAAVNYHFGDKERLYVEAVQYAHSNKAEDSPPEWPAGTPASVRLREYIGWMLRHLRDESRPAWHEQLMMREMIKPTKACVAVVERFIRARFELLEGIVAELLPPETTHSDRTLITLSVVAQCLIYRARNPFVALVVGEDQYRAYALDRLADHITQFTLAALGHGNPVHTPAKVARS